MKTPPPSPPAADLPWVRINMAMTADGKIAPASRQYAPFSSEADQRLLLELRAQADAVMNGARTINAFPLTLGPGPTKYRRQRLRRGLAEYNLRVIVSGSGTVDPTAVVFRHRFSPILLLTTERASAARLRRLQPLVAAVKVCGEKWVDFALALRWLRRDWGVKHLLCEGGGELNAALFEAGLVNELCLTICPLLLGGRHAPTIADGAGFPTLPAAAHLRLRTLNRVGPEAFLAYEVLPQAEAIQPSHLG